MKLVSGPEWDRTVASFDEVCLEQLHAFAATNWPKVRLEPMLFLQNGAIVGGTLVMVQPLPLGLGSIAFSKWGMMLRHIHRPDGDALRAAMADALVTEYADKRGFMLSVLPRTPTDHTSREYESLIARGFKRGTSMQFPNRYLVNLRLDDAGLRKSFHQKWRYHLGKSEKAGLSFERAGAGQLGAFDTLYAAMNERKQFTDRSAYASVGALFALDEPLRPELFFVRHAGELVGGAIIFKAGDRAVYLFGATNDKALPLQAGYFMHWHIMRWLRDNTAAGWYDLGGTDGFQGLHQFKKGMVGDAGVIRPVPPVANYASNPVALVLGTTAFMARDTVNLARGMIQGWLNPKTRPTQSRIGSGDID